MNRSGYYHDIRWNLAMYQSRADKAIARVNDEPFYVTTGPYSNRIAVIVKHTAYPHHV